jgi:hypothetical protein
VGVLVLEPVEHRVVEGTDPFDQCERDLDAEAFEDQVRQDAARPVFYAWPDEWLPLAAPAVSWRNVLAHTLFARDILLLCSDGLTRMVIEPEIAATLQAEPDAMNAANKLVELANDAGGADNITVVIVRIDAEFKGWFSWLRSGSRKNATGNGAAGGK